MSKMKLTKKKMWRKKITTAIRQVISLYLKGWEQTYSLQFYEGKANLNVLLINRRRKSIKMIEDTVQKCKN